MLYRVFGRKGVKGVKFFDENEVADKKSYINILNTYRLMTGKMCTDMCEETVRVLQDMVDEGDIVTFIDMASPEGMKMAQEENVFYVPTVICVEDDEEKGCLEMQGPYNTEELNDTNINASAKWWSDLGNFVDMMKDEECSTKDNV